MQIILKDVVFIVVSSKKINENIKAKDNIKCEIYRKPLRIFLR